MSEQPDGVRERVRVNSDQIDKLWTNKASKESVQNLREDLQNLASKESVDNLTKEMEKLSTDVSGLKKVLIATAISWAGGSGVFLIAVLQLTGG